MFRIDDRAGTVMTTVVILLVAAVRLGRKNRTWAIAEVYLAGLILLGGTGYEFGPVVARQIKNLKAALPQILEGLSTGKGAVDIGTKHGEPGPTATNPRLGGPQP